LFSRKEFNERLPICPWKPFRKNSARDSNLEVQAHAQYRGHKLRYQGFTWDRTDGTTVHQQFTGEDPVPARQYSSYPNQAPADYAGLDLDTGHWSENSTRSIFGWLRFDGFAPGKREIWEHKWFTSASLTKRNSAREAMERRRSLYSMKDWLSRLSDT